MTFMTNRIVFICLTALTILVFLLRICLRNQIDGTVVYDRFIALFSSNMCAIWCFVLVTKVCDCCKNCSKSVTSSKIWKLFDGFTYPIYLTHYMFLTSPFNLKFFNISNGYGNFFIFIALSIFSAFALMKMTNFALGKIR